MLGRLCVCLCCVCVPDWTVVEPIAVFAGDFVQPYCLVNYTESQVLGAFMDHRNFYMSKIGPGTPTDMANRSKFLNAIRLRTVELESVRDELKQEVRNLEIAHRTATMLDFNLSDSNKILTQCKLFGYFLTNCKTEDLGDDVKKHNASCEDSRHPFRISVTTKGNDVTRVNFSLPATSPLQEIQVILNNLSEDNCPYVVLYTIQQFIHLNTFRERIIRDKLLSPLGKRCNFQVYPPEFLKEGGARHYLITAKEGSVEIVWTLVWDKVDYCLIHEFIFKSMPQNEKMRKLKAQLGCDNFSVRNESTLYHWWTDFCNTLALP